MDRAMYLQALREQDPEQFKRLCKSGELEQFVLGKMREAAQIFSGNLVPEGDRGILVTHQDERPRLRVA